jgi:hypothetical protein
LADVVRDGGNFFTHDRLRLEAEKSRVRWVPGMPLCLHHHHVRGVRYESEVHRLLTIGARWLSSHGLSSLGVGVRRQEVGSVGRSRADSLPRK